MQQTTDDVRRLQGSIDDLIGVLAPLALWSGQAPAHLVDRLIEVLARLLRLDFAYALPEDEGGAPHVEWARLAPAGGSTCSRDVAANQAAIGLQETRHLGEQERVARELDHRVAQRTRELAAANEELRREIGERRRMEEKLRQDERELRRITDVIPQAIIVLAPDGTMLHANAFVLEYTGLSLGDIKAAGARGSIFHPDDVEKLWDERQRALSRGEPFELELRARRKDGRYRWFLVRYVPFRDERGRLTRWYATGTDIEDRKRAEEKVRNENLALRGEIDGSSMFEEIVGSSEGLRRVLAQVAKVAPTDSTVLILGETGTGKELIARAIHRQSSRSTQAFIRVNCAAIPSSLITSELFGHEKGAFTGAVQRRTGRFESANGGTIFLDEVGDLTAETQIALLRVLQEREFERIGSSRPISVDVRVLAATHRDLEAAVEAGTFRQDLFYRLNVFPLQIPPLRERRDDIPLLAEYLIARYARTAGKSIRNIGKRTLESFRAYDWPGNVRELQNVVERAVILCDGETFAVDETWLTRETSAPAGRSVSLAGSLADSERQMIEAALAASRGRVSGPSGAAIRLGIARQTLESRIQALHIDKYRFKSPS
ncbi:sigma54 specific transcriptional regulator, Fis family [Anaeromyxobacter sp. Fw109-5]|nr:sigma54 specific transcriptional regulator, Fis family [Anaeromyxobacter sp. Fw109-5]